MTPFFLPHAWLDGNCCWVGCYSHYRKSNPNYLQREPGIFVFWNQELSGDNEEMGLDIETGRVDGGRGTDLWISSAAWFIGVE